MSQRGSRILVALLCGVGTWLLPTSAHDEPSFARSADGSSLRPQLAADPRYVLIGWNDLGMHCMGDDFSSFCILPPANTLQAQIVLKGDPPQLVAADPTLELRYRFPRNTTSSNKVNFWNYVQPLFHANPGNDVGLAGKGMTGTLDWAENLFEAKWIPITPFEDAAPTVLAPYQIAELSLREKATQRLLDQTVIVAPVSTEMRCDKCHPTDDDPEEGGGLPVYDSILKLHDHENGTNLLASKPVLCASCHADAALGAPGQSNVPNLSRAIHVKHAEERPQMGCYDCHPGPTTQCLRDVMYMAGKSCTDCHGTMTEMAADLKNGRKPWLEEPKCATCHPNHSEDEDGTNNLYRQSTGHGGLYCAACHNSPHAILPTVQPWDGMQALRLQGWPNALGDCMICHTKPPTAPGPHGIRYRNATAPQSWEFLP